MAKRKSKSTKAPVATIDSQPPPENEPFFPFARYTSIIGVHTSLLAFTALFFPRMFHDLDWTATGQMSSLDRPQHPFMASLTGNPPLTVASICIGVFILQAWWGGWIRDWLIDYSLQGSDENRRLDRNMLDKLRFQYARQALVATLVSSLGIHAVLILFGAPLFQYVLRTYFLALLLSNLTVFAPAYAYGTPSFSDARESLVVRMTWTRLFAEFSIRTPVERALVYPSVGAAVGAWLGVIPIALDWDRPWQAWPLTPAFGGILGYIVASIGALTVSAVSELVKAGRQAEQMDKFKSQ